MKERPILFSTPMVQAIIAGKKTHTRRTKGLEKVNDRPDDWAKPAFYPSTKQWVFTTEHGIPDQVRIKYPYGEIGDVLWVRETFYALGKWVKNGKSKRGKQKFKFIDMTFQMGHGYMYETDSEKPAYVGTKKDGLIRWYKRPSLFMPYAACRLKLEITGIRVERLQGITEEDVVNEGVGKPVGTELLYGHVTDLYNLNEFKRLWSSINGPESWNSNPFVWVIEFKRTDK